MTNPLNDEERAACAVCADWFATTKVWALVAWVALSLALIGWTQGGMAVTAILAVVLALAERVLAMRVLLDAGLFSRLAEGSVKGLDELDVGLQQVLKVPASKAGRPLAPRIAGAKHLYRLHLICVALITLSAAATWL